jgi:hypothetical protein
MFTICILISHSLLRRVRDVEKNNPHRGTWRQVSASPAQKRCCCATSVCAIHASIKHIHKNHIYAATKQQILQRRLIAAEDETYMVLHMIPLLDTPCCTGNNSNRSHAHFLSPNFPSLFSLLTLLHTSVNSVPIH